MSGIYHCGSFPSGDERQPLHMEKRFPTAKCVKTRSPKNEECGPVVTTG
jgi:hypothetical protein